MQIKTLSLGVALGRFPIIAMTGCGHSHDDGHSHDPVYQEANKPNRNNHSTID